MTPSWVDLPSEDIRLVLGFSNNDSLHLKTLIDKYHALPKDRVDFLQERADALFSIKVFIENWCNYRLKVEEKKKHLLWLSDIAIAKALYLNELKKLSEIENSIGLENYLCSAHKNISQIHGRYEVLTLNRLIFFSIRKKSYWGDFWWTTLDPCHRQLTNYLLIFKNKYDKELRFSISFFMWLETQYVPTNIAYEKYLSSEEVTSCKVCVKNSLLVDSGGDLIKHTDSSAVYLFVLGLDEELYISRETDILFHSSFFHGGPVFSAGKVLICNGQIRTVSFESGHYIPSNKTGYQLFEFLFSKGYMQEGKVKIIFFHDREKLSIDLNPSELGSFELFEKSLRVAISEHQALILNKERASS